VATYTILAVLSPADRVALLELAKAGDLDARNRLVLAAWPLVRRLAKQFSRGLRTGESGVCATDLAGEALAHILQQITGNYGWNPERAGLLTWVRLMCRSAFRFAAGRRTHPGKPSRAWDAACLSVRDGDRQPGREDDPAELAQAAEFHARSAVSVARLPALDRTIYERAAAGAKSDTLAADLGMSRGEVNKRLRRIRAEVLAYADPTTAAR
jgi:RNA polymerase sigma factor (sigma-70 family)